MSQLVLSIAVVFCWTIYMSKKDEKKNKKQNRNIK